MKNLPHAHLYADVLLCSGLQLQPGDALVMILPWADREFGELLASAARERGAVSVDIYYENPEQERDHYLSGRTDKYVWLTPEDFNHIDERIVGDARLLVLRSNRFGILAPLSPGQLALRNQYYGEDFGRIFRYIQGNQVAYCLGALPNADWAQLVFPHLPPEQQEAALWDSMCRAIYLDRCDPAGAWLERARVLKARRQAMNRMSFEALVITGPETELEIKLPAAHLWQGGGHLRPDRREFIANIPTEEIYTSPLREGVNGRIRIRHRMQYKGRMIEDYTLVFQQGRLMSVTSPDAPFARELMTWLDGIDGARFLGEIALVSGSGVKEQGLYFYEPVYDENASCHFAFGSGFKSTISRGEGMDDRAFLAAGGNLSTLHMDVMFDSDCMDIFGKKDGGLRPVLQKGWWALEDRA